VPAVAGLKPTVKPNPPDHPLSGGFGYDQASSPSVTDSAAPVRCRIWRREACPGDDTIGRHRTANPAEQTTYIMPMSGRCAPVYLCTYLYVAILPLIINS
jgi:hypothetical protein